MSRENQCSVPIFSPVRRAARSTRGLSCAEMWGSSADSRMSLPKWEAAGSEPGGRGGKGWEKEADYWLWPRLYYYIERTWKALLKVLTSVQCIYKDSNKSHRAEQPEGALCLCNLMALCSLKSKKQLWIWESPWPGPAPRTIRDIAAECTELWWGSLN